MSIIQVQNLSKRFILQHEKSGAGKYTALRDVITDKFRSLGKKQEFIKKEEFWALHDVSFEVNQGDRVGIIGRNGAGKSTLLKILSRITEPTSGTVKIEGRVASLLEVGTGFHPELTGRENIFLNGAILGMSRAEVRKKFDEIVDFAEVEKFLDTPVKRYSSGMYVRLAFAVAAHMEPEILIVDEVLAVGDAQFQKKCLGKMEEVSLNDGRTVLFVSHNIAAIQALTNKGILLKNGKIQYSGSVSEAIKEYTKSMNSSGEGRQGDYLKKGEHSRIINVNLIDDQGNAVNFYTIGDQFMIEAIIETDGKDSMSFEIFLSDNGNQTRIGIMSLYQFQNMQLPNKPGTYKYVFKIDPINLASGNYRLDASTSFININWDHRVDNACEFEVLFSNPTGGAWDFKSLMGHGNIGLVCNDVNFQLVK